MISDRRSSTAVKVSARRLDLKQTSKTQGRPSQFFATLILASIWTFVLWPKNVTLPGIYVNAFTVVQTGILATAPLTLALSHRRGLIESHAFSAARISDLIFCAMLLSLSVSDVFGHASWPDLGRQLIQVYAGYIVGRIGARVVGLPRMLNHLSCALAISFLVALWESYSGKLILTDILHIEPQSGTATAFTGSVRNGFFRATAFYDHPIILSIAANIGVVIGAFRIQSTGRLAQRIMWGLFILLSLSAIYTSNSRTGLIGLSVSIFCIAALRTAADLQRRRFVFPLVLLPTALMASLLAAPTLIDVFVGRSGNEQHSSQMRQAMWSKAMPYFWERPFLGWGTGSALQFAGIPQPGLHTLTVDNSVITYLIDAGIIGSTFVVVILASGVFLATRRFLHASYNNTAPDTGILATVIPLVAVCQTANSIPAMFYMALLATGWSVSMSTNIARKRHSGRPINAVASRPSADGMAQ